MSETYWYRTAMTLAEAGLPGFRRTFPRMRVQRNGTVVLQAGSDEHALACAAYVCNVTSDGREPELDTTERDGVARIDLLERFIGGAFRLLASPTSGEIDCSTTERYLHQLLDLDWERASECARYAESHLTRAMFRTAGGPTGLMFTYRAIETLRDFLEHSLTTQRGR